MSLLEQITQPSDLRHLSAEELAELATEIRTFLVRQVSKTGGHLGPNLGVVELTMALHRVFDSPADPIIFDTGHQSYVHKILTGRAAKFDTLRQPGGLSGYPSREESEHDWVESSHASSALSWAEGLAKGFCLRGESERNVVAVVGDGALTGGMAWEALNNIAVNEHLPLVILVNDNGRSYTPTVGGMVKELADFRTDKRYEQILDVVRKGVTGTPVVGRVAYDLLHGVKIGLKDVLAPQSLFSDLGLKYIGPIDGHDLAAVERALKQAKSYCGPVIVHAVTVKGKGFAAAETNEEDRFHAVGQIDELTGEPLSSIQRTWTTSFGEDMVKLAERDPRVVGITAAMMYPVGLDKMARAYPSRVFDVGIAEQHAVASAAGMARAGLRPVVAVYATFLSRAFDQVLMDVALHELPVTFVADRAGVTGTDGASHNGMWDPAVFGIVPGLTMGAPRDTALLSRMLSEAVARDGGPHWIRFSKDPVPVDIPALTTDAAGDWVHLGPHARNLVVAYGPMVAIAQRAAVLAAAQGVAVDVVDPVWALPLSDALIEKARTYARVWTIEDGLAVNGWGAQLAQAIHEGQERPIPVHVKGLRREFLAQGVRGDILAAHGLTAETLAAELAGSSAGENVVSLHA